MSVKTVMETVSLVRCLAAQPMKMGGEGHNTEVCTAKHPMRCRKQQEAVVELQQGFLSLQQ